MENGEAEKEKERDRGNFSRVGGEREARKEKKEDDATMDGWMGERVVTTPARAPADLDCPMVNARMTACSYVFLARATQRRR